MPGDRAPADDVPLPLTARSVLLSLLLGAHPPTLQVRDIVGLAGAFDVPEPTVRVALTRMVAAGDLLRTGSAYRLADRLLDRQRRQDEALHPRTVAHHGRWEMAVVTVSGRPAAERAELRSTLVTLRLAELREGVWLRPANLRRDWPADLAARVSRFRGEPADPAAELASTLWDLPGWAEKGRALLARYSASVIPAQQLPTAAAIVRHLSSDPVLPSELLPADWPGADLRRVYSAYRDELVQLVGSARTA